MPNTFPDDLEDDVRDLMAAQEELSAAWIASAADGFSTTSLLAELKLSPETVARKFTDASHFVSVVLSRLQRDPGSIDLRLWEIETHSNQLWALRQQALVGSCEASRGVKEYADMMKDNDAEMRTKGLVRWTPCCVRIAGECKLSLWQQLGEMSAQDAQLRYIRILTDIAPNWSNPLSSDSALLKTWTPDGESDRCTVCGEIFTFLNRRHHCRRCSSLVCAVCSPHSMPLRVFSNTLEKPQRICDVCFQEIQHQRSMSDGTIRSGAGILDPKADGFKQRQPDMSYSFASDCVDADENDAASQAPSLLLDVAMATTPARASLSAVLATIHCGDLELLHGAGFRKNWDRFFFVLLIRKGSLGMFLAETDHVMKKKRPAAVYKLSGYTIRIKSQKRRPHQFRLSHTTKRPLHFAATSIEDMNLWISQLIKAIDNANELESQPTPRSVATAQERRGNEDDEAEV